jgi:hypothetical protein
MHLLNKILLFGGWFYLSLFLFIITFLLFKQIRSLLIYSSLVFASLIALSFFKRQAQVTAPLLPQVTLTTEEKLDRQSFHTYSFAQKIKPLIPPHSRLCIYYYVDVETVYLVQELYPLQPQALPRSKPLPSHCQYVISPMQPLSQLTPHLLLEHHNNYLYQIP